MKLQTLISVTVGTRSQYLRLAVSPADTSNQTSSISITLVSIPDGTRHSTFVLAGQPVRARTNLRLFGVPDGEYILSASRYSLLIRRRLLPKSRSRGPTSGLTLKLSAMASIEGRLIVQHPIQHSVKPGVRCTGVLCRRNNRSKQHRRAKDISELW